MKDPGTTNTLVKAHLEQAAKSLQDAIDLTHAHNTDFDLPNARNNGVVIPAGQALGNTKLALKTLINDGGLDVQ